MDHGKKRPAPRSPLYANQSKRSKYDGGLLSSERSQQQVVALLVLTEPCIVTKIMQFAPCDSDQVSTRDPSCLLRSVAALCRAMTPFDRSFSRNFGPDNHAFWREMILQRFDFSDDGQGRQEPKAGLAVWPNVGVYYRPAEYGFLREVQSQNGDFSTWPTSENAFSLYCDLVLLTEKMFRFISPVSSPGGLYCCMLKTGPPDPQTQGIAHLPRGIRRSRRHALRDFIANELKAWTAVYSIKPYEAQRKMRLYGGRSRHSERWLGFIDTSSAL